MTLGSEFNQFPNSVLESIARIPHSVQFLMNQLTPMGYVFIRRFLIWFPICCLASSFIMQTHVVFDCTRSLDEEELEFDDSSEMSEEIESPLNTNLNSPRNTGSTADAQPHSAANPPPTANRPPGGRRHVQPSDLNLPRAPSSWVDLHVPQTPPPDESNDRNPI